ERTREVVGGREIPVLIGLDEQLVHQDDVRLRQASDLWLETEPLHHTPPLLDQHLPWAARDAVDPIRSRWTGNLQEPRCQQTPVLLLRKHVTQEGLRAPLRRDR